MGAAERGPFHRTQGFSAGVSPDNPTFLVDQNGGARLSGNLTVSGTSAITGTQTFTGAAAFSAAVTMASTLAVTGAATLASSLTYSTAGLGPILKQGANGLVGTFIANGTAPVTVSNTAVAISDAIIISLNTVGGTVGVQPHVATITAATGFTVVCTASDTSTYNYTLVKNAA